MAKATTKTVETDKLSISISSQEYERLINQMNEIMRNASALSDRLAIAADFSTNDRINHNLNRFRQDLSDMRSNILGVKNTILLCGVKNS